jgi:hypothetical protein
MCELLLHPNDTGHNATNRKAMGSIPSGIIEFFIDIIPATLWPWVYWASNNISWE